MLTKKQKKALVKRLYELADGAEPVDTEKGICRDIRINLGWEALYFLQDDVFGYVSFPLGRDEFDRPGDHWIGERGNDRRTLAGFAAAFIETELM